MKQNHEISLAKKIFLGIDIFIIISFLTLIPKIDVIGITVIFLYLILVRANLSLMLLQNERKAIWIALAVGSTGVFFNSINLFLDTTTRYLITDITAFDSPQFTIVAIATLFLYAWFFFMPVIYSIIILLSKHKVNNAKLHDLFALTYYKRTIWKAKIINLFYLFLVLLITQIIGIISNNTISIICGIPFSIFAGWLYLKIINTKWNNVRVSGIVIFAIATTLLLLAIFFSQTLFELKKIVIFAVYTLGLPLCFILIYKTYRGKTIIKIVHSLTLFFIVFIALPVFAIGYNIFSCMDYARGNIFVTEYSITGVYLISNKDGKVGLRDRVGMVIPVEYEEIADYDLPYIKIKQNGLWGVFDESGESKYYNSNWQRRMYTPSHVAVPCKYHSLEPVANRSIYAIVSDNSGNKGLISVYNNQPFGLKDSHRSTQIMYKTIKHLNEDHFKVTDTLGNIQIISGESLSILSTP